MANKKEGLINHGNWLILSALLSRIYYKGVIKYLHPLSQSMRCLCTEPLVFEYFQCIENLIYFQSFKSLAFLWESFSSIWKKNICTYIYTIYACIYYYKVVTFILCFHQHQPYQTSDSLTFLSLVSISFQQHVFLAFGLTKNNRRSF